MENDSETTKQDILIKLKELDKLLVSFKPIDGKVPDTGWIKEIRTKINMSRRQLGERYKDVKTKEASPVTSQAIKEFEEGERAGTISLNSLRRFGKALGLKLVYGFVHTNDSFYGKILPHYNEKAEILYNDLPDELKIKKRGHYQVINSAVQHARVLMLDFPRSFWDKK